ncbi:dihydroneopterin aldolase [Deminuibacter soli]|uniref:7,8-dihydroneopterin aldolase n=1 Tax=Deminuibacter soli TaxID=2291815 RepID=A0A3E1NGN5_9BACT|nr:dihydroneopterin aldolase [Deminuibacter soli]RFM27115.1 dihydroneopterin aldolase [Deminuibacter soli]
MLTIELSALQFFAYHGLYEEEKRLGNRFELDVTIVYQPGYFPPRTIDDTLDYVSVYSLIKQVMEQREDLLETVLHNMAHSLFNTFAPIHTVQLYLKKQQPPIVGFEGVIGIRYSAAREANENV